MSVKVTVGEFKARMPEILSLVQQGKSVVIAYGRAKKPIAVLSPPPPQTAKRRLGLLAKKFRAQISPDWEISEADFLGS